MKIVVINGNARHGSTWHCKDLFIQSLLKFEVAEITEFTLPRDMPHFCNGCFSCIYHGEHTCPHADKISPIVAALENSDVIVLIVTTDASEHLVICRVLMTVGAKRPGSVVLAGIDREILSVVIECRRAPCCGCVTGLAIRWELGRKMRRVITLVVIGLVAADTGIRGGGVIPVVALVATGD